MYTKIEYIKCIFLARIIYLKKNILVNTVFYNIYWSDKPLPDLVKKKNRLEPYCECAQLAFSAKNNGRTGFFVNSPFNINDNPDPLLLMILIRSKLLRSTPLKFSASSFSSYLARDFGQLELPIYKYELAEAFFSQMFWEIRF